MENVRQTNEVKNYLSHKIVDHVLFYVILQNKLLLKWPLLADFNPQSTKHLDLTKVLFVYSSFLTTKFIGF